MDKADLVLHEGRVVGRSGCDSLAITGGRITTCGPFAELKALVGPRTHLIRLNGRTVAPGFIDSHLHFLEAGAAAGTALWRCRTLPDLLVELRVAASKTPPGNWLRAFGCDETILRERRGPTRQELDQVVPRNPLRLRHQTLHASWLNSRAIAALGLERPDFTLPGGTWLERDQAGRLTGLVYGMEQWLMPRLPLVTAAELEARARIFSRELAAAGVTAFTDATVRNDPEQAGLFARFASAGTICQRVALMIGAAASPEAIEEARRLAGPAGIRLAGLKFMPGVGHGRGPLSRRVADALARGLDFAFHATEVEELETAVAAIESARAYLGAAADGAVCRIEHGGLIPPDYLDRIATARAWIVANPGFVYYRGAKYMAEPGLLPYLYRGRSLERAGIAMAGATDAPVTPARPLVAIAAAAARTSLEGYQLAPEEKLTIAEACALFTSRAAKLARLEAGEIADGNLADLIVLPVDPNSLSPAELMNLPVEMTMIGGRVVYERGRPAVANSASAELHSP